MNLPLKIRHRFNRAGAFDLRRRVLIKNFLQHHKVKIEVDEHESKDDYNQGSQENYETADTLLNVDTNNEDRNRSDSVLEEPKFESKGTLNSSEDNLDVTADKENTSYVNIGKIEPSETIEPQPEFHNPNEIQNKTSLRQKLKRRFSIKRKCKKDCNSHFTESENVNEVCHFSDNAETPNTHEDYMPESSGVPLKGDIAKSLNKCTSKMKTFTYTVKNRVENVNKKQSCYTVSFNGKAVKNGIIKGCYKRLIAVKERHRKKSALCDFPKKSSRKITSFFKSKSRTSESVEMKQISLKRKHSEVEVPRKSVSIQTDLTFSPQDQEYCRARKRFRSNHSDECSSENHYWLRSFNDTPLRPINGSNKQWQNSKVCHSFSEKNNYLKSSKIVRSQSLQDKASYINGTSCRRVKSVYMRNSDPRSICQCHGWPTTHCKYCTKRFPTSVCQPTRNEARCHQRNIYVPKCNCCSYQSQTKLDSLF